MMSNVRAGCFGLCTVYYIVHVNLFKFIMVIDFCPVTLKIERSEDRTNTKRFLEKQGFVL
jgi:hypothetical protein